MGLPGVTLDSWALKSGEFNNTRIENSSTNPRILVIDATSKFGTVFRAFFAQPSDL
jgi:hypothetical protein